ncbi:hypothetical protein SERLA73DRAFT_151877 [Serpula lacrymans var. lacrymans S7.3]|uniref:F-box domain-containing protein n=1 Tax=Serpula lacrymans var. lacrymans (strain S7.3) TaxID=936435 RepID=F8PVX0_SERL3|nr:hypothetical protein SERLA73DRAFT_151877 [Serpula lacrymans var. lacrymans S7.3]
MSTIHIPEDILCHIFSFLDFKDLLRCSAACEIYKDTIDDSSLLQCKIELGAQRMVSLPGASKIPASELYELLWKREQVWYYFGWRRFSSHTVGLPPGRIPFVSTAGGLISLWDGRLGEVYELPADLSERSTELQLRRTHTHPGHLDVRGVAIDPSQDLSVLVTFAPPTANYTYDLHLKTINTNEPHPLAGKSHLASATRLQDWPYRVRVRILGPVIAFLPLVLSEVPERCFSGHVLQTWNWKEPGATGVRQGFVCSPGGGGTISCNAPYLSTLPWTTSLAESYPLPFYPDSQERICAITFGHVFFIDMRVFFSSHGVYSTQLGVSGALTRPWASWGPQNSRCFPSDWPFGVFGSKAVGIYRVGHKTAPFRLKLREFNPYLLRRNDSGESGRSWVVTSPSTISANHAFAEDVTTCLPYREAIGGWEWFDDLEDTFEMSVDDSRVVIVKAEGSGPQITTILATFTF